MKFIGLLVSLVASQQEQQKLTPPVYKIDQVITEVGDYPCGDGTHCPGLPGTCCDIGGGEYGCCPFKNGVCCAHTETCCASG